jgi:hypothetical protein
MKVIYGISQGIFEKQPAKPGNNVCSIR